MYILGLTGSIAMGKTEAAKAFSRLGVTVFGADTSVHRLLASGGGGVARVGACFPDAIAGQAVDRKILGQTVFNDPEALARLEAILHPLVRTLERTFLRSAARRGDPLVVLDIPLLFETHGERRCDAVAVVSAPPLIQRARVLRRPGMTARRLSQILARQMADSEKRRRADFIIQTGLSRAHSLHAIQNIVKVTRTRNPRKWRPGYGRLILGADAHSS